MKYSQQDVGCYTPQSGPNLYKVVHCLSCLSTNHRATVGNTVLLQKAPRGATPSARSDPKHRQQPPIFEDSEYPNHVYKISKALYGFKQAPRAWYECLRDFLIANGFKVGKADPTLFTKTIANDLFVCQIYVDDIIFGSTNKYTCEEFSRIMVQKFEMSMMGELKYFLGF
jgi:hypothetical protein